MKQTIGQEVFLVAIKALHPAGRLSASFAIVQENGRLLTTTPKKGYKKQEGWAIMEKGLWQT